MIFHAKQYQKEAAERLLRNPYMALFADPGAGKTAIILMVLTALKRRNMLPTPVLVTAPSIVCDTVWEQEATKWDQFDFTFAHVNGTTKARKKALESDAEIHLVTHEYLRRVDLTRYRVLIIDESSRYFTKWTGATVKMLRSLIVQKHFARQHILTGTPAPNSLMSLFSQQYLADRGAAFGSMITPFRTAYFNDVGYNTPYSIWEPKRDANARITAKLAPHSHRIEVLDHLDMPELSTHDIMLPPNGASSNLMRYFDIENFYANLYVQARRDAGGIDEGGHIYRSDKIDALKNLVAELHGKPVIVFFKFVAEGIALLRELKAPCIDGSTSAVERLRLINAWNESKVPILLINPAAAGHGINLQRGGHDLVWYTLPDNQDHYTQAIARVWRQGVEQRVRVHRLLVRGSIDIAVQKSLAAKGDQQKALLDAIKELQHDSQEDARDRTLLVVDPCKDQLCGG